MYEQLQEELGYTFRRPDLLREALIHSGGGPGGMGTNERLSWLGDTVVNLVVSDLLFKGLPDFVRGALDGRRQPIVRGGTLATVADDLGLESYLTTSAGRPVPRAEITARAKARAFEAVVGAIYIDRGMDEARTFVQRALRKRLAAALAPIAEHGR